MRKPKSTTTVNNSQDAFSHSAYISTPNIQTILPLLLGENEIRERWYTIHSGGVAKTEAEKRSFEKRLWRATHDRRGVFVKIIFSKK